MSTGWGFEQLRESQVSITPRSSPLVLQVGENLPDAYSPDSIPEVGELDELETFVGSKKTKSGCGQPLTTSNKAS
jgi:hypothetical protein